jgi:hypothetical protein
MAWKGKAVSLTITAFFMRGLIIGGCSAVLAGLLFVGRLCGSTSKVDNHRDYQPSPVIRQ